MERHAKEVLRLFKTVLDISPHAAMRLTLDEAIGIIAGDNPAQAVRDFVMRIEGIDTDHRILTRSIAERLTRRGVPQDRVNINRSRESERSYRAAAGAVIEELGGVDSLRNISMEMPRCINMIQGSQKKVLRNLKWLPNT